MATKKTDEQEREDQAAAEQQPVVAERTLANGQTLRTEAQPLSVATPEQPAPRRQSGFVTLGRSDADGIPQFSDVRVVEREDGEK